MVKVISEICLKFVLCSLCLLLYLPILILFYYNLIYMYLYLKHNKNKTYTFFIFCMVVLKYAHVFIVFIITDLLDEYLKWLPESAHNEVTLYWPPL